MSDGSLEQKQILSTLSTDSQNSSGWYLASDIHCTDNGKFLYVSNRDMDNQSRDTLAVFSIDQNTGHLTHLGNEPTHGLVPRNFAIDGNELFVANQNSNDITHFSIDQRTGKLQYSRGKFNSSTPECLKIVDF